MESWKDKQPKVDNLSDVVELAQEHGARRDASRRRPSSDRRRAHTTDDCLNVVGQDLLLMSMIIDQVIDITRRYGAINTFEGRTLAERVAELVNTVLEQTARVVPVDQCPWINPRTPIY